MAKISISATSRSIYIASDPPYAGDMTLWALRDFVRSCDEAGIPDEAKLVAHHATETRHLVNVSVRHTVVVEPAPEGSDG
jgi:hypothetical protein